MIKFTCRAASLLLAAMTCQAQPLGQSFVTLRGNQITNVTGVKIIKETGRIIISWPGGGGSYDYSEVPRKFLDAWGIEQRELLGALIRGAQTEIAAEERQSAPAKTFAATFPGLGHIKEIRSILEICSSGLKDLRRYHFSPVEIKALQERRKANPSGLFQAHGMEIEKHLSFTFPLTVYKGTATNGMQLTVVTMHTNVLRIRLSGINRLQHGKVANKLKVIDLHVFAGLIEGIIERHRTSSGDAAVISEMLEQQFEQIDREGRFHTYKQAPAFWAFSCLHRGEDSLQYTVNICDSKLGRLYALKTVFGHPDSPVCPGVAPEGLVSVP